MKTKTKGEAGNAISKLCTGQATKTVLVDRSAEPLGAHWDAEIANEYNIETKHVQTYSNSKYEKWFGKNVMSLQTKTKLLVVRQVIQSTNYAPAERQTMYIDGSLCWAFGSTLGWRNSKWMKHRNETCSDMYKIKRLWNSKNAIVCWNWNKILSVVRQVMQSANCAPARQLRITFVDLTWRAVLPQVKSAVYEKRTVVLCWTLMLSTMSMNHWEIDQWECNFL